MEMIDMGHKMKNTGIVAAPPQREKVMYPSLHLSHKVPQFLKDKKIGHTCRLEVVGKVISMSQGDMGEDMTLEIHQIGYVGSAGKKTEDEYLKMPKEDREKYDEEEVTGKQKPY